MDIDILNSGTPDSKNWLNPVFDVVTCNKLITSLSPANVNCFASISNAAFGLPPSGVTQYDDIAIDIRIANINLVAGKYTAPEKQNINAVLSYSITQTTATANSVVAELIFTINTVPIAPTYRFPINFTGIDRVTGIWSSLIPLEANDILGYRIRYTTANSGANASDMTFSGFVL